MNLPADFIPSLKAQLGEEWPLFKAALNSDSPTSIHYNLAKNADKALFSGSLIPWNLGGAYLSERPSFTLDPHFHAGRYYVQEAGSMFLVHLLKSIQADNRIETALDLCAAPGGKTTLLLNYLSDESLVVANEVIKSRYSILQENIAKWGRANVISTQGDPKQLADLSGQFDLVLVDAPCSGEGLFRKQPKAMEEWSLDHVQLCESRQRRILANALPLLRAGGYLIYSTCTYNSRENDGNVDWILAQGGFEVRQPVVPEAWNITITKNGFQCYPHRIQTEGFYVSLLQKTASEQGVRKEPPLRYFSPASKSDKKKLSQWVSNLDNFQVVESPKKELFILNNDQQAILARLSQSFSRITPGTPLGTIKGKDLVPAHDWALSIHQSSTIPTLAMDKANALAFLRKQDFTLPTKDKLIGWHLVSYDGNGLGWVKLLPNRINNYLPKHLRIRKV